MDYGISEKDFWEMTLAELIRLVDSKKRTQLIQTKEKAMFDYTLANLIGRSIARLHSSANHYPSIAEAYPSLFTTEEIEEKIQDKKNELSVLKFKQFAQSYNKKFKEVAKL